MSRARAARTVRSFERFTEVHKFAVFFLCFVTRLSYLAATQPETINVCCEFDEVVYCFYMNVL
jgi:hypothetical protein